MANSHFYNENGYDFVECSETWKLACSKFPCFDALQWPGYRTKVIDAKIDGKDVVIQLWRGTCQKALGIDEAPGGIGAEVGVYRRLTSAPRASAGMARPIKTALAAIKGSLERNPFWLPFPKLKAELSFELVHPQSGETFFKAGPDQSYWCCKWMNPESYKQYKKDCKAAGISVPKTPDKYVLKYRINDMEFVWN